MNKPVGKNKPNHITAELSALIVTNIFFDVSKCFIFTVSFFFLSSQPLAIRVTGPFCPTTKAEWKRTMV